MLLFKFITLSFPSYSQTYTLPISYASVIQDFGTILAVFLNMNPASSLIMYNPSCPWPSVLWLPHLQCLFPHHLSHIYPRHYGHWKLSISKTTNSNIMCSDHSILPSVFVYLLPLGPFFNLLWTPTFPDTSFLILFLCTISMILTPMA